MARRDWNPTEVSHLVAAWILIKRDTHAVGWPNITFFTFWDAVTTAFNERLNDPALNRRRSHLVSKWLNMAWDIYLFDQTYRRVSNGNVTIGTNYLNALARFANEQGRTFTYPTAWVTLKEDPFFVAEYLG